MLTNIGTYFCLFALKEYKIFFSDNQRSQTKKKDTLLDKSCELFLSLTIHGINVIIGSDKILYSKQKFDKNSLFLKHIVF